MFTFLSPPVTLYLRHRIGRNLERMKDMISNVQISHVDPQRRSVWLRNGRRLGFAEARRQGLDVEALVAERRERKAS